MNSSGEHMTDYIQALTNICFTMVTGVVSVASVSAILFMGLLVQNMISDYMND